MHSSESSSPISVNFRIFQSTLCEDEMYQDVCVRVRDRAQRPSVQHSLRLNYNFHVSLAIIQVLENILLFQYKTQLI